MLDRLQYRERLAVGEARALGAVPALLRLGTRFGVANRALMGV